MTTEKNVATLTPAGLPVDMSDLEQDSHLGGKIGLSDMAVPFIYVLQTNSPQCNPDDSKYIAGARAGMLYLTVMEKIFDGREKGVTIIDCYYESKLPEWRPRESGGGIVMTHETDSTILEKATPNEKGIPTLPNGNLLVTTHYHYVLVKDENTWYQAVMPMKSTALKVSRKMNSIVSTLKIPNTDKTAPRFLYTWNLKTIKETKLDNTWSSPVIFLGPVVDRDGYTRAKDFCLIARKGIIQTSAEATEAAPASKETEVF